MATHWIGGTGSGGGGGGSGVPVGGTAGQYLAKNSGVDGDASWIGPPLTGVAGPGIGIDTTTTPGSAIFQYKPATSTWAARGTGTYVGQPLIITDLGNTTYFPVFWDGTYWKAAYRRFIYFATNATPQTTPLAVGTTSGTLQTVNPTSIPAGAGRLGSAFVCGFTWGKSGATDAVSASSLKVGSAGTTADANMNAATQANTVRSFSNLATLMFTTTEVIQLGTPNSAAGGYASANSTSVGHSVANAISNIDSNAIFFSPTIQLGGTTDTPQLWDMFIEVIP